MKKAIYWGTIIAGAAAAYMMHKRGETFGQIAKNTILNPVGSFANEIQAARV
ncbi:hypothetical protein SAMN05421771_2526 [Granulicella pectinivorans]|uniref:Uncharacterized protein n=1 Tax=Granulicella pectinivorans TaxID=474950 RepID=A0A1I6MFA2_9BACT|nr:hypothetical protein [Granulicella pectinivorans]SFS14406.1 hypothetical protein SAMN05421771_2526 [Granulicella pectinivorans]